MKIKMYQASILSIILRFYLLLAVVTIGLFTQQTWMYIVGYAIVVSCMMGLKFEWKEKPKAVVRKENKEASIKKIESFRKVS